MNFEGLVSVSLENGKLKMSVSCNVKTAIEYVIQELKEYLSGKQSKN
jgi:hypothetical protein